MRLPDCKPFYPFLLLLAFSCAQEVTDEIYSMDLDSEKEVVMSRKRDTDVNLPDLVEQPAVLPMDLLSSISVSSMGSVNMRSTVDVVGQAADSLLADLGTRFAALETVGGFYKSSDVFPILYPFIMQLMNPTPRVIVQVQQLLVVQRLECCKSGEETCCGIIARMMTDALTDKYEAMKNRLNGEERYDSHRVNWRQLDSLLDMPPIALDELPEENKRSNPLTHKFVEDQGDSIKISKRNKQGRLTQKTMYPQVPNHMLDEDVRRPVDEASLHDGDAAHVFSLDDVIAREEEDKETKAETSKDYLETTLIEDQKVDSAEDPQSQRIESTEKDAWVVTVPRRKLLSISDEEEDEDGQRKEEVQDTSWVAPLPKRRLMEVEEEEEEEKKSCKYKEQMVPHAQLVKNENCFNCSCVDGRILCHSKFVCDASPQISTDLEGTMKAINKLMSLGRVTKADIKDYLQYRSEFLLHIENAKVAEDSTLEAMEMIYNGGNGPGGLSGVRMLPSLIKRLDKLHEQRETQMKIFLGLVQSLESVKQPVHEEL